MQPNLITHLLRKDLRHVAIPLGLWAVLLLAQAVLIGTGFSSSRFDLRAQFLYTAIALLIPFLQSLLVIVLVPLLVQDEPLVGSSSYWLTRPISRWTVLVEKLLFFSVFLVLPPIVVQLIVFAVNGVQPSDMLVAIPQFLISGYALVLPLMVLASLTSGFGRYALLLVGMWIILTLASVVFGFTSFIQDTNKATMQGATDISLPMSRGIATSVFTILAGLGLVCWQYATRQTRSVSIAAGVALAVVIWLQSFWPINFLQSPNQPATLAAFEKKEVTLSVLPDSINTSEQVLFNSTDRAKTTIHATLAVSGLPAGYQLSPQKIDGRWLLSNGQTLKATTYKTDLGRLWLAPLVDSVLNGPHVINAPYERGLRCDIFSLPTDQYNEVRSLSRQYTGQVEMNVLRYSLFGEAALKIGERIKGGSTQVTVLSVLKQPKGCKVIIRESLVNLWFAGDNKLAPFLSALLPAGSNQTYVLVNRARGEALLHDDTLPDLNMGGAVLSAISPLVNRTTTIEFTTSTGRPVIDDAWLQGASLVRLEKIPAGTYTQTVEAPNLPLSVLSKQ